MMGSSAPVLGAPSRAIDAGPDMIGEVDEQALEG